MGKKNAKKLAIKALLAFIRPLPVSLSLVEAPVFPEF
jgi:hypothetical protein